MGVRKEKKTKTKGHKVGLKPKTRLSSPGTTELNESFPPPKRSSLDPWKEDTKWEKTRVSTSAGSGLNTTKRRRSRVDLRSTRPPGPSPIPRPHWDVQSGKTLLASASLTHFPSIHQKPGTPPRKSLKSASQSTLVPQSEEVAHGTFRTESTTRFLYGTEAFHSPAPAPAPAPERPRQEGGGGGGGGGGTSTNDRAGTAWEGGAWAAAAAGGEGGLPLLGPGLGLGLGGGGGGGEGEGEGEAPAERYQRERREAAYQRRTVRSFLLNFLEEEDGSLKKVIDLEEHALETGKPITDATIQEVCKLQPNLVELRLANATQVGDVGLWAIARHCPDIQGLSLAGCTRVTAVGLRALALRCPRLRTLDLSRTPVGDAALRTLASGCWALEDLQLRGCTEVSDAGLVDLAKCCTNLTALNVSECTRVGEFGDVALVELGRNCRGLRALSMLGCRLVRDEGLQAVARGCRGLDTLLLTGCTDITGKGIKTLADKCTGLEQLSIAGCHKIRNADLAHLATACRSLRTLDISGCAHIGERGLHHLATRCRSLQELNLRGCSRVDDRACLALAQPLNRLRSIDLRDCAEVSEDGVRKLALSCTGLGYLNLTGCRRVGRRFLMNLITELKFSEPAHEYYGYQPRPDADELRAEMEAANRRVLAAVALQCVFRRRAARAIAWRLRREWVIRYRLAQVQASIRRFLQRKRFLKMWAEHVRNCQAAKIQAQWRAYWGRKQARLLEEARLRREKEARVGRLTQRLFRGHVGRGRAQELRDERARRELEEAQVRARQEAAAVLLQARFRTHRATQMLAVLRREKRLAERLARRRHHAAIMIQKHMRAFPAKARLAALKEEARRRDLMWKCARRIQGIWRQRTARLILRALAAERARRRLEAAATLVQSQWRASRGRFMAKVARTAALLREKERRNAVRVQAAYRGLVGRRRAQARRALVERQRLEDRSARVLQRVFRGHKGRERYEVSAAVLALRDRAAPLARQQAELERRLAALREEAAAIDAEAEPRAQRLAFLELEVKKVLDTKATWFDSASLSGRPQRYLTKYLQTQLSEQLTKVKEDAEDALDRQAAVRARVRETERVLRQVKRELLPLKRGVELETKELRTQRLRSRVRGEKRGATLMQALLRGHLVRAALRSETAAHWGEYSDEATGDVYYYNTWTEDTRWVQPMEMRLFQAAHAERPKELGWKEEVDETTGLTYFFNEVVMEYRWSAPPEDDEITLETTETRGSRWFKRQNKRALLARSYKVRDIGAFEEWEDPEKDLTFYYNPQTMEAKWSLPPHEAFKALPSSFSQQSEAGSVKEEGQIGPEPSQLTEPSALAAEEWVQVEDPSDGATYYYNGLTGESSWEVPEGYRPRGADEGR